MKYLKIFAVLMAACLLGAALVSCNFERYTDTVVLETEPAGVEVTLIIKDGSKEMYSGTVVCNGKLGNAIELFCAGEFEEEFEVFNSQTKMLTTIGELTAGDGKSWIAYYDTEGQEKAFESIRDQEVKDGKTIVVVLQ